MEGTVKAAAVTAETLLRRRRTRAVVFDGYADGFGEPAWDALLLLTCAEASGEAAVPIAAVIQETRTIDQTAMAYLGWLETKDLVWIAGGAASLTERGRSLMGRYLAALNERA